MGAPQCNCSPGELTNNVEHACNAVQRSDTCQAFSAFTYGSYTRAALPYTLSPELESPTPQRLRRCCGFLAQTSTAFAFRAVPRICALAMHSAGKDVACPWFSDVQGLALRI